MTEVSEKIEQKKPVKSSKKRLSLTGIALIIVSLVALGTISFFSIDHISQTNPNFCAICHNMRSHVDSYLTGDHLDNLHFQASVGCKSCHANYSLAGEMKSVVSYVTGQYDDPMQEADFPKEGCLRCHRSYTSLAEKTANLDPNPHSSHLGEVDCTLCHKAHKTSEVYCTQCHQTELTLDN